MRLLIGRDRGSVNNNIKMFQTRIKDKLFTSGKRNGIEDIN